MLQEIMTKSVELSTLWPADSPFAIAFKIGTIEVRWYAIMSILGYALAILVFCMTIAFKYKIKYEPAFYFIFLCLPMCILGARFWSACIGDLKWSQFFEIGGGLAIQGGVVFGLLSGIIYFPLVLRLPKYHVRVEKDDKVYIQQPSFFIYADAIIPTILLGQAIGRWGNFFNGEIFGSAVGLANEPNSLDWLKNLMPGVYDKMIATNGISNVDLPNNGEGYVFQPLFLYESFLGICSFLFIYFVLSNIRHIRIGVIAGTYFVAYGLIRFSMEPLRNSSFEFAGTYIMNGLLLGFGILWIIYCQFVYPKFRMNNISKTINAYFGYLKQKMILKNGNNNKKIEKNKQKILKLEEKLKTVSIKTTNDYESKITKQFKIKEIKDKITKIEKENDMFCNLKALTLKEYFSELNVNIKRCEGDAIYFANK